MFKNLVSIFPSSSLDFTLKLVQQGPKYRRTRTSEPEDIQNQYINVVYQFWVCEKQTDNFTAKYIHLEVKKTQIHL